MSVGLFVVVLWWGVGWLRADVYAACSVCVGGLSWGDVDSCRDVPQYKVMKYLVFGIILTSLLRRICTRSTRTRIRMDIGSLSECTEHSRGGHPCSGASCRTTFRT